MRNVPETAPHTGHSDVAAHHIAPISLYVKIYGALLVLTVLTVSVSFADLGSASFATAMVVAAVKASLVAAYFMHLRYDDRLYSFIMVAAVLFVGLFFAFTYLDLFTRGTTNPVESNFELRRDQQWQEQRLDEAAAGSEAVPAPPAALPPPAP